MQRQRERGGERGKEQTDTHGDESIDAWNNSGHSGMSGCAGPMLRRWKDEGGQKKNRDGDAEVQKQTPMTK